MLLLMPVLALIPLFGTPPGAGSSFRIEVWPRGTAFPSRVYTLDCPDATGTLPAAQTACRKLAPLRRSAFAPVPPHSICTQIYGGRQVARITGTFLGRRLDAVFTRRDGCQINRWNRLAFLFPVRVAP
ncbi:MAG: SSI family serine proteinase inhibitor [Gaiellaceae bacterium]